MTHHDTNPHNHPQTTEYLVEFLWRDRSELRRYYSIEGISRDVYKEKNRRAKGDRVVNVRYQNVLTDHGKQFYREKYDTLNEYTLSENLGIAIGEWMKFKNQRIINL